MPVAVKCCIPPIPTALPPTPKPIICAGCLYCAGIELKIGIFLIRLTPIAPLIAPLGDTPPILDVLPRLTTRVAARLVLLTAFLAARLLAMNYLVLFVYLT
jgi:hypothetical protein